MSLLFNYCKPCKSGLNDIFKARNIYFFKNFSTTNRLCKGNYYSDLEIGSGATQNEIKTAYYRLSKMYHPDKNEGSEKAAEKFRNITAAYEVLGNIRTRKLYDRGLANVETVYENKSYESSGEPYYNEAYSKPSSRFDRISKKPSKVYSGRTDTFDFDEWTKAHYTNNLNKIFESRDKQKKRKIAEEDIVRLKELDTPTKILCITIFLMLFANLLYKNSYDDLELINKAKASKNIKEPDKEN